MTASPRARLLPDRLVDGVLLVSPSPRYRHQDVLAHLHLLLAAGCPRDLKVLFAPCAVALAGRAFHHGGLVVPVVVQQDDAVALGDGADEQVRDAHRP